MTHACRALTTLFSAITSMLLVGPAKCHIAGTELGGMRACQSRHCEAFVAEGRFSEPAANVPVERCLVDACDNWNDLFTDANSPYFYADLECGSGLVSAACPPISAPGLSAALESVWNTEHRRCQRTFPATDTEERDRRQQAFGLDLQTGYDRAYDQAMLEAFDTTKWREQGESTSNPIAVSLPRGSVPMTSEFVLYDLRVARVLRQAFSGTLWKSSSEWIRRERPAILEWTAHLDRLEAPHRLTIEAANTLEQLGHSIAAAGTRLRQWAGEGQPSYAARNSSK